MSGRNEELLSAYFDGELSEDEKSLVEQLLAEDVAAREALDDVAEVSGWIRSLPRPTAPTDVRDAVLARVRAAATPVRALVPVTRPGWRRHVRWAAASAAGLLLAVVLYQSWPVSDSARQRGVLDVALGARLADGRSAGESEARELATTSELVRTASVAQDPMSLAYTNTDLMLGEFQKAMEGGAAPVPGEEFQDFSQLGDRVVVIQYRVVDTQDLPGRVQMVLTQNGIVAVNELEQVESLAADSNQNGSFEAIYLDAPTTNFNTAVEQITDLDLVTSVTTNNVSFAAPPEGSEDSSVAAEQKRVEQLSRFSIGREANLAEQIAPDTDTDGALPQSAAAAVLAAETDGVTAAPVELPAADQSVAPTLADLQAEPLSKSFADEAAPADQAASGKEAAADAYQVLVPVRQELWERLQEHEDMFWGKLSTEALEQRLSLSLAEKQVRRQWYFATPRVQGPPAAQDRVRAVILLVPQKSE